MFKRWLRKKQSKNKSDTLKAKKSSRAAPPALVDAPVTQSVASTIKQAQVKSRGTQSAVEMNDESVIDVDENIRSHPSTSTEVKGQYEGANAGRSLAHQYSSELSLDSGYHRAEGEPLYSEGIVRKLEGKLVKLQEDMLRKINEIKDENTSIKSQLSAATAEKSAQSSVRAEPQGIPESQKMEELEADNIILKQMVHRLNVELSRYLETVAPSEPPPHLTDSSEPPASLTDTKNLVPLLKSYDVLTEEKDALIKTIEEKLEETKKQYDDVTKENKKIQQQLKFADTKGPITIAEWQELHESATLVLQENERLVQQILHKEQQLREEHTSHLMQVRELSAKLEATEGECRKLEVEVSLLQGQNAALTLKVDDLQKEVSSSVHEEDHKQMVEQHKREYEKLKRQSKSDKEILESQLGALEETKQKNEKKITNLNVERNTLLTQCTAFTKSLRKCEQKLVASERLNTELASSHTKATRQLDQVVDFAERLLAERHGLVTLLQERSDENATLSQRMQEEALLIGQLQEKLKNLKNETKRNLNAVSGQLVEQSYSFSKQEHEYKKELKHLRHHLKFKEELIEQLTNGQVIEEKEDDDILIEKETMKTKGKKISFDIPERDEVKT